MLKRTRLVRQTYRPLSNFFVRRTYSTQLSDVQEREQLIKLLSGTYTDERSPFVPDATCNISSNIIQKLNKNLHLQTHHPLNTVKTKIQNYFNQSYKSIQGSTPPSFSIHDNLFPAVSTQQNFDYILVPEDHVSRRPQDTYYINPTHCLRTHTSAHQNELLKSKSRAFLVTGDVYRRDTIDKTHYPVFHQMEGVRLWSRSELPAGVVSEEFLEADMKSALENMVKSVFGSDVKTRWVDAYFPFTHPSLELEIFFEGEWLEVLGCGVIHPKVLELAGNTNDVGWAFGVGLERIAMALWGIQDIRLFWSDDPRFKEQFVQKPGQVFSYKSFSKFPSCVKDISFWLPQNFHEADFFDLVRKQTDDMVELVELIDTFVHPKTQLESRCYRIHYRSNSRSLTNEEVNEYFFNLREELGLKGVQLR